MSFEEAGLVMWWVLAVGLALGLLPRRRPATVQVLLLAALAAYAIWTALSLLWTQSSELTTEEVARSLDYLGLVTLAVFVLDRETWRAAAAGLGFAAFLVCVIALGSRLDPAVFGKDQVAAFLHSDRLAYPFGYWNAVAAWGAMCTALGLIWSAHDSARLRRSVALAMVPVAVTMTYVTYSRGGIAGTALALIATLAISRNRCTAVVHATIAAAGAAVAIVVVHNSPQIAHGTGTHRADAVMVALVVAAGVCAVTAFLTLQFRVDRLRLPKTLRRPVAVAIALAVLVPGVVVGPPLARRAWRSFKSTPTATVSADPTARLTNLAGTRYVVWKAAIKAFDAHPADGTGAGTFEFTWNQDSPNAEFVRDTHNIWLQNMAELGLPGLLLIVAVAMAAVGLAVAARIRARRGSSVGVAAAFLAVVLVYLLHASVDWMWESTAVTVLALAGVAVVGTRLSGRPLRLRLPTRGGLVVIAAIAAIVQLPGILSTNDIRKSQVAERTGDTSTALALARDAISAEPWSADAHEQQALVLEADGQLQDAKQQESLAISDEPTNYAHYLIRSRIETELGELDAAVRDYTRARQLRPKASVFALAPYFVKSKSS